MPSVTVYMLLTVGFLGFGSSVVLTPILSQISTQSNGAIGVFMVISVTSSLFSIIIGTLKYFDPDCA